jgi:hypothetical protein
MKNILPSSKIRDRWKFTLGKGKEWVFGNEEVSLKDMRYTAIFPRA